MAVSPFLLPESKGFALLIGLFYLIICILDSFRGDFKVFL